MNVLGSTLSAASSAIDLARANAEHPEIAGARAASGSRRAAVAKNGRSGRASVAAQAAARARRLSATRAKLRAAASGWAGVGSAKGTAWAAAAGRAASAQASRQASSKGATGAARGEHADPLAFLDDPKLSVEEKLMRLLEHMNARWEKDMKKKLDEIAGRSPSSGASKSSGSSGSSSKGNSFLGKIVDGAKKFFPAAGIALDALKNPAVRNLVGKIGGPVLAAGATALGFPALAPALLKYGPAAIDFAAGAVSGLDQGGSGEASKTGGSGEKASSGNGLSEGEMKVKLIELQRIQDVQKEMFALVSNYMRSNHELKMNLVGNLR